MAVNILFFTEVFFTAFTLFYSLVPNKLKAKNIPLTLVENVGIAIVENILNINYPNGVIYYIKFLRCLLSYKFII